MNHYNWWMMDTWRKGLLPIRCMGGSERCGTNAMSIACTVMIVTVQYHTVSREIQRDKRPEKHFQCHNDNIFSKTPAVFAMDDVTGTGENGFYKTAQTNDGTQALNNTSLQQLFPLNSGGWCCIVLQIMLLIFPVSWRPLSFVTNPLKI